MDRDDQLAEIFGRWKAALEAGRPLTPEEACAEAPDLLDDFRSLLPQLAAVDALFQPGTDGDAIESQRIDADGYRSVSFHKQGGLGVVMVGEDVELRRTVALKRLQARFAVDTAARARFVAEAEVTARLDHPGVVPVYRMGRDAAGQPFYAMRFIQGETLGAAIRAYHDGRAKPDRRRADHSAQNLEFRRLVRALIGVCETVAYAHARGVIHRDLKPDNIMLGAFGETVVLDWGLAKRIDSPATEPDAGGDTPTLPEGIEHTLEGRAKGSPAFMSPEQARGEWSRVGPAGDIYSLGSTLYVLLTGRMPYAGKTAIEIVDKVKQGRFNPPRQMEAKVPKDLDAVCRKAMAFEPADRYADARAMATDLERWLADEPVTARREPRLERTRRWFRRHRTAAVAGVTAFVLIAAGVTVAALQQRRLAEREGDLFRNLTKVNRLNRQLVVGMRQGPNSGNLEQYQALAEARSYFEERIGENDPEALFELGGVENTEGNLRLQSGDAGGAMPHFDRAAELFTRGLNARPNDPDLRWGLTIALTNQGAARVMLDKVSEAKPLFDRALTELDAIKSFLDPANFQMQRLRIERGLALFYAVSGADDWLAKRSDDGLSKFDLGYRIFKRLEEHEVRLPEFAASFEGLLRGYSAALAVDAAQKWKAEQRKEAIALYRTNDEVLSDFRRRKPDNTEIYEEWARNKLVLGFLAHEYLNDRNGKALPVAERRKIAAQAVIDLDTVTDRWPDDRDRIRVRGELAKIAVEAGP